MIYCMSAFMPEEHLAPIGGAAFDFQHLVQLEGLEARMRQVKGNGNRRHTFRREPLVAELAIRSQRDTACRKLIVELLDARTQFAMLDPNAKIADAHCKQLLILKSAPKRLGLLHCFYRNVLDLDVNVSRRLTGYRENLSKDIFRKCRILTTGRDRPGGPVDDRRA